MTNKFLLTILLVILIQHFTTAQQKPAEYMGSKGFIENKGQIIDQNGKLNPGVLYFLPTHGLNVQLRESGFSYDVFEVKTKPVEIRNENLVIPVTQPSQHISKYKVHRVDVDFIGSNKNFQVIPSGKSKYYHNYYTDSYNKTGVNNVHTYQSVVYKNIYNDIDIVFFIPEDKSKTVEYNFIIRPGGNIDDIKFKVNGAKTRLEKNAIKMKLRFGDLLETMPLSWLQDKDGKEIIDIAFKKVDKNTYGFSSPKIKNPNKTLIIDPVPVRLWGTYASGEVGAFPYAITTDSNDNVYVTGATESSMNIATVGTHLSYFDGVSEGFISKYNTTGQLVWGTYYAATTHDITVDSNFNVIFGGAIIHAVPNITSPDSEQPNKASTQSDGYLVKLNSFGVREWGRYIGSVNYDIVTSIVIDSNNDMIIAGSSASYDNIATPGAYKETLQPGNSGFLAKISGGGYKIWGTYCMSGIMNVSISHDSFIYTMGVTQNTTDVATPGAFITTPLGSDDGYINKFSLNGTQRIWGTYLGGPKSDSFLGAKLVGDNYYLMGRTYSESGIATSGTFYPTYQDVSESITEQNSFVINFNTATQQVDWGTYFIDQIVGLDVNENSEVYFSGTTTYAYGVATSDAYMPVKEQHIKTYIIKLNQQGQRIWGTYYGGNSTEQVGRMALGSMGNIFLYGATWSNTGIATAGAQQSVRGSGMISTYLAMFRDCMSAASITGPTNVCPGKTIQLSAQGGTGYVWSGPNNFSSTSQSINIPNASTAHNGPYSCSITGGSGCDGVATVEVIVADSILPVPDLQTLPETTGNCSVTVSVIPTATDSCAGIITATTTDPLQYDLAGTYTINWNYNDGNGNTKTQPQIVKVINNSGINVNTEVDYTVCTNATGTINLFGFANDITTANATISFHQSELGAIQNTGIISNSTTYPIPAAFHVVYVRVVLPNGCGVASKINMRVQPPPVAIPTQLTKCATANSTSFNLNDAKATINNVIGNTFSFYATLQDLNNNIQIADSGDFKNTSNPQKVYVKVTNTAGCSNTAEIDLIINNITEISLNDFEKCSANQSQTEFDLTVKHADILGLLPTATYIFSHYDTYNDAVAGTQNTIANIIFTPNNTDVYYRAETPLQCPYIIKVKLVRRENPVIQMPDKYTLCNGNEINISPGQGFDSYSWSTLQGSPVIAINSPGSYWVTVRKNYTSVVCETTHNFIVDESDTPQIKDIVINDWTDYSNSVTINTFNNGPYEYSIDGITFQQQNTFYNLQNGLYKVYATSIDRCGIDSKDVVVLMYPKFFTPNNDNHNDYWRIEFSASEPDMKIKIFDRFGKYLYSFSGNDIGWDGTSNGNELPSSDYWFVIERESGISYKGHFSLIR